MTNYREILRLHSCGISQRGIASSCQYSRNTVNKVLARAKEISIRWPLKDELTDGDLEKLLFPDLTASAFSRRKPDLEYIHLVLMLTCSTLRIVIPIWSI